MNGIILASGFSRRMGQNKLLMKINNKEIIKTVIQEIKKSNIEKIILVARDENVIKIGTEENIAVIKNNNADLGQSESIKLGVKEANIEDDFMFFCGDQPFLDKDSINRLIEESKKHKESIIIPKVKEKHGNPVIFPKKFKDELENLSGDIGGKQIINSNKKIVKYIELDNELFLKDIDTIEEYERYINKGAILR